MALRSVTDPLSKNQSPGCLCFCSDFQTEVIVIIHHKTKSHRIDITTAAQAGRRCTKASQNAVVLDLVLNLFMTEVRTLWEDTGMTLTPYRHQIILQSLRMQTTGSIL